MYSTTDIEREFQVHPTLKKAFWKNGVLNPRARDLLLKVVRVFLDTLDKPVKIKDITFTGSLANYNYSEQSDVDLHIVINYSDLGTDKVLVDEYIALKKSKWNQDHDISIFDHPVEVYVEDAENPHTTTGLYSILQNKWIKEPVSDQPEFDATAIATKANHYKNLYHALLKELKAGHLEAVLSAIVHAKEKIKAMRNIGLKQSGQFSTENLVFKVLRRAGMLDALTNLYNKAVDAKLSLEQEV